jgi:hypothetical protein
MYAPPGELAPFAVARIDDCDDCPIHPVADLPSGKDQLRGLIVTRLKVTVSLRRENHVVWTGQATTVRASGTRTGDPSVVATALSDALLTWFPRQVPGPLSVP